MEEEYIEKENNHNHRLKKNNNCPKTKIKLNNVCDLIKIPINQLNSIDVNILTGNLYRKIYEEALEEEKNRLQNNFEENKGSTSKKKKLSNKNGVQKIKNNNDDNRDEDYFNSRKNNNSVHLRKKNYNEVSSSSSEKEEERKDMSDIRRVKSKNSFMSLSSKNNDEFLLSNSYNNLNLNFYRNNLDNFNTFNNYNNYNNRNSKSNNKKNNNNNNYNNNSNNNNNNNNYYNYNNMTSYNNNNKYADPYKEKNNKNNFGKTNDEYRVNGELGYRNANSNNIIYNKNNDKNYEFSNSSDSLPKHFFSSNINLRNNLSLAYPLKKIVFVIKYNSSFGEEVGILGSLQILGNWEQKRVFKLKWNSGHIWKGEIFVTNDSVKDFEFKFVILQNNSVKNWENGSNNKFNYDLLFNQIRVKRKGFYSKYDYDYNIYNGELVLNCKWSS